VKFLLNISKNPQVFLGFYDEKMILVRDKIEKPIKLWGRLLPHGSDRWA
jgi:hypothetical protein